MEPTAAVIPFFITGRHVITKWVDYSTFHIEDCLCGEKKIVLHFIAKNHSLYHCGTYEYSLS